MRGTHGWSEVDAARKREIIEAIVSGQATRGPVHAEIDITDRCNVACYFCNQQDVRTKDQISLAHLKRLVDELAEGGLRSIRMSGGGDPLFHREILEFLDHLHARGIVVDNLTTNGALLNAAIAERLVAHGAREVIFSLNAVDAADYHRMMQSQPATFQKVVDNVRGLVAARRGADAGQGSSPCVVVQFLIDRENYRELPRMYELGRSLGADRISVASVLAIPLDRIREDVLLRADDAEALRPYLTAILERDKLDRQAPDRVPASRMARGPRRDPARARLRGGAAALPDGARLPRGQRPLLLRLVHGHDPRQRRPVPLLPADAAGLQAPRQRPERPLRGPLERSRRSRRCGRSSARSSSRATARGSIPSVTRSSAASASSTEPAGSRTSTFARTRPSTTTSRRRSMPPEPRRAREPRWAGFSAR